MRIERYIRFLFLAALFFLFAGLSSEQSAANKDLVKAASIRKIAEFIDWPQYGESFNIVFFSSKENLKPFGTLFVNQQVKGRPIVVRYASQIQEVKSADIVYVSEDLNKDIDEIVLYFAEKSCLLIGESIGYANKGVHINFYVTKGGTLHFEINPERLKKSGLSVNSMLLEYAKVVR